MLSNRASRSEDGWVGEERGGCESTHRVQEALGSLAKVPTIVETLTCRRHAAQRHHERKVPEEKGTARERGGASREV